MSIANLLTSQNPSDQSYLNITVNNLLIDGNLTFGGSGGSPTPLNYYEQFSMTSTFSGAIPTTPPLTIKITRIGNMVYLGLPVVSAAGNNSSVAITSDTAIPVRFRPTEDHRAASMNMNNGVANIGNTKIQPSGIILIAPLAQETYMSSTGTCGLPDRITMVYPVD